MAERLKQAGTSSATRNAGRIGDLFPKKDGVATSRPPRHKVNPEFKALHQPSATLEAESESCRAHKKTLDNQIADAEHITAQIKEVSTLIEAFATVPAEAKLNPTPTRREVALDSLCKTLGTLQSKALQGDTPLKSCASMQLVRDLVAQRNGCLRRISASTHQADQLRNQQISENKEFLAEREVADANRMRSELFQEIRDYEERLAAIERSREEKAEQSREAKAASERWRSEHKIELLSAFPEHLHRFESHAKGESIASEVIDAEQSEALAIQELESACERRENDLKTTLAYELQKLVECKLAAENRMALAEERERKTKEEIAEDLEAQTAALMQQLANSENAMHETSDALESALSQELQTVQSGISRIEHEEAVAVERAVENRELYSHESQSLLQEAEHAIGEVRSRAEVAETNLELCKQSFVEAQEQAVSQKEDELQRCELEVSKVSYSLSEQQELSDQTIASLRGEMQSQHHLADTFIKSERALVAGETEQIIANALAFERSEHAELEIAEERLAETEESANLVESVAYELSVSLKMDAHAPLRSVHEEIEIIQHQEATSLERFRHEETCQLSRAADDMSALVCTSADEANSIRLARQENMGRYEAEIMQFKAEFSNAEAARDEFQEQFNNFQNSLEADEESSRLEEHRLMQETSEEVNAQELMEASSVKQLQVRRDEAKDEEAACELEACESIEASQMLMQECREAKERSGTEAAEEMTNAFENERKAEQKLEEQSIETILWKESEVEAAEANTQAEENRRMQDFEASMAKTCELVRTSREEQEIQIRNARIYDQERQEAIKAETRAVLEADAEHQLAEELCEASRGVHREREEAARKTEQKVAQLRHMEEKQVALLHEQIDTDRQTFAEITSDCELRSTRAAERERVAEAQTAFTERTLEDDLEELETERREQVRAADNRVEAAKKALIGFVKMSREAEDTALIGLQRHATSPSATSRPSCSEAGSRLSVLSAASSSIPGWSSLSDSAKRSRYQSRRED